MKNATPHITLITKTRTQNQGNQALSIAWRDYLSTRYPEAQVRLVERAPGYLKRYTLAALACSSDPVAAFDALARSLLSAKPKTAQKDPSKWNVEHDPTQQQVVRFKRLRQVLRLRSRLASLGVGATAYLDRLAYICSSDLVVVNPAGEFQHDATDSALSYLLETRCAQLSGRRTAFVNLSFEIANPTLISIADHVFHYCDVLEFRDIESREYFAEVGGRKTPIVLSDGAILSKVERSGESGGKGLALAINALQVNAHRLSSSWDDIVAKLRERGPITLTSNEWTTDHPFWKKYLALDGVHCEGQQLSYDAYARFLSGFDVVVTSRLHTSVLGLVAGAAVVPMETGTFKLTGFFNQIGMPDEPIRMGESGWQERLLQRIADLSENRETRIRKQDEHVFRARDALRSGLDASFNDDLLKPMI